MVGILPDMNDKMTLDFKNDGDVIYLIGESTDDINSSEYLHKVCGVEYSPVPQFDLEKEFSVQQTVSALIKKHLIESAHDISEGGLFVTLAESAFPRNFGLSVKKSNTSIRNDAYWFGESQGRIIVTVSEKNISEFEKTITDVPFEKIGTVTKLDLEVDGENWGNISSWKEKYDTAIEKYFN